ncbi:MAG: efflux RND transporter periplasmic adaptor subunit [Minisyncoccota bacterium]
MSKLKSLIKSYKFSIPLFAIIVITGIFLASSGGTEVQGEFVTTSLKTISQEVDVTGRVRPAQEVELAVQSGGRVSSVNVAVGDSVYAGQSLVNVDDTDLVIRLGREQAALEKAKLELAKLEPKTSATNDFDQAYEDGFNSVSEAFIDLPNTIRGVDSLLSSNYLGDNSIRVKYGDTAREYRWSAYETYYDAKNAYDDLFKIYKSTTRESTDEVIEKLVVDTYEVTKLTADTVKNISDLLDYIEARMSDTEDSTQLQTDQATLNEYTNTINTHLTTLLEVKSSMQNAKHGIADEGHDLTTARINVRQAELDVEETQFEINKRVIKSPANGIVSKITAKVGETVSSGVSLVTVISADKFEIEADVPEADMAKIRIGSEAFVTLDAYGSDELFTARVISVEPAETLIDGVATYRTILQFDVDDERIRSGMTADITIYGDKKESVIAIPQRAVISKDENKFVRVMMGEEIVEKIVETGFRGSDGTVEIVSGLEVGEKVVVFSPTE